MQSDYTINFFIKQLSVEEIERFLLLNDNNLFEKLSDRLNIHDYSEKLFKQAVHFTLYEYEHLVGFSPCYFNNIEGGKAYISALIVNKGYKNKGLEEQLLNAIKAYAKKNKFKDIFVSFHCNNLTSTAFYEKNAFIKHSKEKNLCKFCFTV